MTEAMPFLQKYDITFLRPPTIWPGDIYLPLSYLQIRVVETGKSGILRERGYEARASARTGEKGANG